MRRPRLLRGTPEAASWDGLVEGMPNWLYSSVSIWVYEHFLTGTDPFGNYQFDVIALRQLERELRMPLPWGYTSAPIDQVMSNLIDPTMSINILDWCVGRTRNFLRLEQLEVMLSEAGSAWTIGLDASDLPELQRRVDSTVKELAKSSAEAGSRPAAHLAAAWSAQYGTHQDPTTVYRESVKAVEAAAHLVISPNNSSATLGTMIADLRNAPGKWTVQLKPDGVDAQEQIMGMMQLLWKAQLDRHGTADEGAPLSVTRGESEAALHLAATLVHLFTSGGIQLSK